jgi:hypothetical protein
MPVNNFLDAPKTALSALLLDKEHRVVLSCGIVHGYDQVPELPLNPFMPGAVLVKHHANIRGTRTTLSMGSFAGCFGNQLSLLQPVFYPGVTPHPPMGSSIPAVKVLDRKPSVPTTIQIS